MAHEFMEDKGGVHLMGVLTPEHTLCGQAFDAFESGDADSPLHSTTRTVVTCPECARQIKACKTVKTRSAS